MKEDELKDIFLAEALEGYEELNKLFTELEKDHGNKRAIDAIFRITHTLKANAAGMGFMDIAEMAHTMEDIFSEIRSGKLQIENAIFNDLFRAVDVFGAMINKIKDSTDQPIRYKGIKTKLEVLLRVARYGADALPTEKSAKNQKDVDIDITLRTENEAVNFTSSASESAAEWQISLSNNIEISEEQENEIFDTDIDSKISFSDLIQIPVRKLDNLMNLVGELIIERDRVATLVSINEGSRNNEFSRLQRITSELQYSVMDVRLVQVNVLFNKFHRIVRDTAAIENKQVNLELEGTENEIDRSVLQIISDSLVHVVRNAVSHGIERVPDRKQGGKPETGKITISAKSEKDAVVIEVKDDGKGIDVSVIKRKAIEKGLISAEMAVLMSNDEIIQLIFEPGFSSAEQVTAVSGRGVGMDVVKRAIDSIGGKIIIKTEVGTGSIFSLSVPSSMALKGALLFELDKREFAIPLSYTDAVIQIPKQSIHKVAKGLVATHLNKTISIVFLNDLLSMHSIDELANDSVLHQSFEKLQDTDKLFIVVVSYGNRDIGFVVDKLLQQKEIVEKPLLKPLDDIPFISGATILGSGNVCLVLDIPSIVNHLFKISRK